MDTERWQRARLVPIVGERGHQAQERRATSVLLAVMTIVPEFGKELLAQLGAPRGRVEAFVEVPLKDDAGRTSIPDGVITVTRGKTEWACLVETKTGGNRLAEEQVSRYVDLARAHGFNAVLTISNQIAHEAGESPVQIDGRRLRSVSLRHLSWWRILTEAVVQQNHRGVSDPEQAWILGELIAYLSHPSSGVGDFDDLGDGWVAVRDGAKNETLVLSDSAVDSVASRWEEFTQYLCLSFRQDLGRSVSPVFGRKSNASIRLDATRRQLVERGTLETSLRVPDTVGAITLSADLRARRLHVSTGLGAPDEGRAKTRINWLVRQLSDAPPDLRIDVRFAGCRESATASLSRVREDPSILMSEIDAARVPREFLLTRSTPTGKKRGQGRGSFIGDARRDLFDFYENVVQVLRPWSPRAPQLHKDREKGDEIENEHARPQVNENEGASSKPADLSATTWWQSHTPAGS